MAIWRASAIAIATILLGLTAGCGKSEQPAQTTPATAAQTTPGKATPPDPCATPPLSSSDAWLPVTPQPDNTKPPKHPASDCFFYRPAWQRFLFVTQPSADGAPAFLSYASIEDVFGHAVAPMFAKQSGGRLSLAPRTMQTSNAPTSLEDETQAGPLRGLLIDQHGRPVFYAIHMNPAFVSFLQANKLTTKQGLENIDEKLTFPPGIVELKSAWTIVDSQSPPSNYFTVEAQVPQFSVVDGKLTTSSKPPRLVTVALLAIHVVFSLEGHPELIWSTFEHVNGDGLRDNAPAAPSNPSKTSPTTVPSKTDYPLYKAGTQVSAANIPIPAQDLANLFDEQTQTFTKGGTVHQTSVYRPYPGSKSDGTKPDDSAEDSDIIAINTNVAKMFGEAKTASVEKRQFYRLVGAVWINDPTDFKLNQTFENPINQTTDQDGATLAGEGRLASTAMESFTEREADDPTNPGQPNCFSCHDTRAIHDDRPPHKVILPAKLLNVSHIMSKFLSGVASNTK